MVQQHLSQDEFQIILVHVHMRARYFIITHVREVESRSVAVTGLRGGVDVSAALQELHILLGAQDGSHVEPVMWQTVALQYICPLGTDSIQLPLRGGNEIRHGVRQTVHDIVLVRRDLYQLLTHGRRIGPVLGWPGQTDLGGHRMLLELQIIELELIVKRPTGIPNQAVFDDSLFFLRRACSAGTKNNEQ